MMAVFCYCSVRGYQFTKTVRCLFNVHFPRLQKDYRVPSQCFRLKIEQTIDWKYMFKYSNYETTTLISYRNYANVRDHEGNEDDIAKESETILSDKSYIEISKGIFSIPGVGHRILLVHPVVKSRTRIPLDVGQRQIAEAVALVETLSNWKVIDQMVLSTKNTEKKHVFGDANLEKLRNKVVEKRNVSAVFVNIHRLSGLQYAELEALLGLPIYDRYNIVLNIFKEHSRTKVAKLQVALAEIPLIRSRLKWLHFGGREKESGGMQHIGGAGETFMELRKRLLKERETKLKAALKKVKVHREMLRKGREKKEIPTVAVVGYTNAGKTTLIKSITGDKDMHPVDQLFATLDVTAHGGFLPSRMPVIFIDTVGFISDIPTSLIDSFLTTLEDAIEADLIVHVRDLSHPDTEAQKECVLQTLKQINIPENMYANIIEVGNKIDLISEQSKLQNGCPKCLLVSATQGTGLGDLTKVVEDKLFSVTDKERRFFRVPNGGIEARWLYKEATVCSCRPDDDDDQFLVLEVIIGKSVLAKFHHHFKDIEEKVS